MRTKIALFLIFNKFYEINNVYMNHMVNKKYHFGIILARLGSYAMRHALCAMRFSN